MKMVFKNLVEPKTFLDDYINNEEKVMTFYDYPINRSGAKSRYEELMNRSYQRPQLVEALKKFNKCYTESEATFSQIDRLEDPNSVVVIGGQQAGLLTGPVYTVNKVLSILHEAHKQERELNVPVIPIFWIAGEDHDIDEVNHTFFHHENEVKKIRLAERNDIKQPASERIISSKSARELVKESFQFLNETEHTKKLYTDLLADVKEDSTYVEWFARILHRLFDGTGLVLMDAGDRKIRELERPYFRQMVLKNDELRHAFYEGATSFQRAGFGVPIEINEKNAHIFIHNQGQRCLLEKEEDTFKEKQGKTTWDPAYILQHLDEDPLLLSNNVVTRPVMQDLLLPVLSFVSGPGELKYWGTLKNVFHEFGIRMPLVLPRVNVTLLSRKSEKNLEKIGVAAEEITMSGIQARKQAWLDQKNDVDVDAVFQEAVAKLESLFTSVSSTLPHFDGNESLQERYKGIVSKGMDQYHQRVKQAILDKHSQELLRYDVVETEIRPDGNWQERHLNIYPFLNVYGEDLIQRVTKRIIEEEDLLGKHLYISL